jgi:hypothetical protein
MAEQLHSVALQRGGYLGRRRQSRLYQTVPEPLPRGGQAPSSTSLSIPEGRLDVKDLRKILPATCTGFRLCGAPSWVTRQIIAQAATGVKEIFCAATATSAPAPANARAIARPMPRPPPVTRATWPARSTPFTARRAAPLPRCRSGRSGWRPRSLPERPAHRRPSRRSGRAACRP